MFIIFSNISAVIKQYLGTMSRLVTLKRNKYSSFHHLFFDRKHQWLMSYPNCSKDKATKT